MNRVLHHLIPKSFVTRIIILLWGVVLIMVGMVFVYWQEVVTQIRDQEQAKADLLVPLYATQVAEILENENKELRDLLLSQWVSQIMLAQDKTTQKDLFEGVTLELLEGNLGVIHLPPIGFTGFTAEALVISETMKMPVGLLQLYYSGAFFERLRADGQRKLLGFLAATLVVLLVVWRLLISLVRPFLLLANRLKLWNPNQTSPALTIEQVGGGSELVQLNEGFNSMFAEIQQRDLILEQHRKNIEEINKRFQTVVDSLEAIVYVADMQTYEILFINKYARMAFDECVGLLCWKAIQVGQLGPCSFCTNKYLLTPSGEPMGVYAWEFQNTHNHRWYAIRDQAIRWPDGRLVRLEIALDITDQKKTEEAIRARKVAENANRAKTRFLATVSHDIRQPLSAQTFFLESLNQCNHKHPADSLVKNIQKVHQNLVGMFEGLMDLSKLEAGVIQPHVVDVALGELFGRLQTEFKANAETKGLKFRVVSTQSVVKSDPVLLESILRNLLSNALRYTHRGGVLLGCRTQKDEVSIQVLDTGPGIPKYQEKAVFNEFFRLEQDSGKEQSRGLGLGLSIVQGFSQRLGHPIRLVSRPGFGSRFLVNVPKGVKSSLPKDPVSFKSLLDSQLGGAMVVVVDNDSLILTAIRSLLELWRCQVITASSGIKLTEHLKYLKKQPNAIICDYYLDAEERGDRVIRQVQSLYGEGIGAILITAEEDLERLEEIKKLGVPVLRKPVAPAKLRSLLRHVLKSD